MGTRLLSWYIRVAMIHRLSSRTGFAHHSDASGDVAHSDSVDNCCNSSACNFAYPAVDFLQATPLFPNLPVASIESAFSSADLALSIKPPMLDVL